MERFENRVVLVTGGSRGLGATLVEAFLAGGASVVTCARHGEALEARRIEWAERYGDRIVAVQADIQTAAGVRQVVEAGKAAFGGLDILVANAAYSHVGPVTTLTDDQWQDEFEVKILSLVRLMRLAVPAMQQRGGGTVVVINAIFSQEPDSYFAASSVMRSGIAALTKLYGRELASLGIRVNAVGLGLAATESWGRHENEDATAEGLSDSFLRQVPLRRMATPQEVANVVLFLASDRASYVTGTQWVVDGGWSRSW